MLTLNMRYLYLLGSVTSQPRQVVTGEAFDVPPEHSPSIHSINYSLITLPVSFERL
jgi:hypothetical protein